MSFDEMIAVLEKAFRLHGSGLRHRCGIRRGGRQVRVGVRAGHEENRRNRRTSRQGEERLEEHSAHRAEAGGTAGCDPAGSVPFRSRKPVFQGPGGVCPPPLRPVRGTGQSQMAENIIALLFMNILLIPMIAPKSLISKTSLRHAIPIC